VLDYLRFSRMLLRGGELDGVRLLKPETVEQMTRNHLAAPLYPLRFGDYVLDGEGYGLGVGVIVEPSAAILAGSAGTYEWAGSSNTDFWIDPVKELIGMFMSQLEPRAPTSAGREYWSLVCQAVID
jgi:CubicO group peptidase (beta-lactamase class C family)